MNTRFDKYLDLVVGLKGREKYASLQVQWMELLHCIYYEPASQKAISQKWFLAVKEVETVPSTATECAITTSIGRAVFNFCQQSIVAIKEGESLLFKEEKELDEVDEAGFTADEASLYCLGGFALFVLLKTKSISEKVLSILKNLCLPLNEKVDIPSNIQHLDKGSLTFMKKELLGCIGMVHVIGFIMY